MTHTPAPWIACQTLFNGKTTAFRIACNEHGSSFPLAECAGNQGKYNPDEMEANARLIAAAPDLLFALEAIVALDGQWSNDSYAQAERAIAKARGQS